MLQRIQTIYLTLSFLLLGSMLFLPVAKLDVQTSIFYSDFWYIIAVIVGLLIIHFFAISLYKHRIVQIRVTTIASIANAGFLVWIGYTIYFLHKSAPIAHFGIACLFPVIAIILNILAIRRIGADEALVHSYERLRK